MRSSTPPLVSLELSDRYQLPDPPYADIFSIFVTIDRPIVQYESTAYQATFFFIDMVN